MHRPFIFLALFATLGLGLLRLQGQQQGGQVPPTADPYANNADAGATKFPLAAPAGKDSGAINHALPGGVNQGVIDEKTWVRPRFRRASKQQDLESSEAQDDARRESNGRNGLRLLGSFHLLRYGERRLRLHLDRDAA